jgi:hypothetical protein
MTFLFEMEEYSNGSVVWNRRVVSIQAHFTQRAAYCMGGYAICNGNVSRVSNVMVSGFMYSSIGHLFISTSYIHLVNDAVRCSAIIILSGVRLSPLGTAATIGVLYQPQMTDDGDCGAIGGMKIGRGNLSTRRKPAPLFTTNPT